MKSKFLFCTKFRYFIGEIPLLLILAAAIYYNNRIDGFFKLYPLIFICAGAIIFIFVYFFRAVSVSFEEIKDIGRFSPRDKAVINKGKTLIITLKKRRKICIELFGNDGKPPFLPSMDENGDSDAPIDINLFRGFVIGSGRVAISLLRFFGVRAEDAQKLIASDGEAVYESITVTSSQDSGLRQIKILFTETLNSTV